MIHIHDTVESYLFESKYINTDRQTDRQTDDVVGVDCVCSRDWPVGECLGALFHCHSDRVDNTLLDLDTRALFIHKPAHGETPANLPAAM